MSGSTQNWTCSTPPGLHPKLNLQYTSRSGSMQKLNVQYTSRAGWTQKLNLQYTLRPVSNLGFYTQSTIMVILGRTSMSGSTQNWTCSTPPGLHPKLNLQYTSRSPYKNWTCSTPPGLHTKTDSRSQYKNWTCSTTPGLNTRTELTVHLQVRLNTKTELAVHLQVSIQKLNLQYNSRSQYKNWTYSPPPGQAEHKNWTCSAPPGLNTKTELAVQLQDRIRDTYGSYI